MFKAAFARSGRERLSAYKRHQAPELNDLLADEIFKNSKISFSSKRKPTRILHLVLASLTIAYSKVRSVMFETVGATSVFGVK